jgi:hypothetical protein
MESPIGAIAEVGREISLRLGVIRSPRWLRSWSHSPVNWGNRPVTVAEICPALKSVHKKAISHLRNRYYLFCFFGRGERI